MTTLDEAKALIERMKDRMLPCSPCERMMLGLDRTPEHWEREGWVFEELSACHAARFYVKHSPSCDGGKVPAYPWASRLDAERVRKYMEAQTSVWPLSDLEALV